MDELKQKFIEVINTHLENPDISAADIQALASAYESLDRNFAMKELVKFTSDGSYFTSKKPDANVCLEEQKS